MISGYQEMSQSCDDLRCVFTLYTVYVLSHLPTGLMQKLFFISIIISIVYMGNNLSMHRTTSLKYLPFLYSW